ncbi:hypothetical protein [Allocoleopsis franciscana]|uniref:Uncharacterized protein n=1 Tax=Allocoleopsis franciscana PCC 7113 TaxID=1173027 RepID=K9WNE6_9CYAN|nr:hypothetical protein [Allocoleopsis franciscana]AFZ21331.1 hypothetical protein Mic7113_5706 [Allocoleopsis franciscana PCC 7113]
MKRRDFIQYGALGSASFVVNLGLHNPKPADAFLFLLLRGALMDAAFGALLQGAFALARHAWGRRSQEWYDRRLEAQLAQSKFIGNSFTNVAVAEVNSFQYSVVLAAERSEQLGKNIAFGFPQMRDSEPSVASFAGPSAIGMAIAAQYMRENQRMSHQEVQAAILPTYQDYNDFTSWSKPTSYTAYSNIAGQDGVLIEYRLVKPGKGGHGIIDVVVNANRRIEIPSIQVKYA